MRFSQNMDSWFYVNKNNKSDIIPEWKEVALHSKIRTGNSDIKCNDQQQVSPKCLLYHRIFQYLLARNSFISIDKYQ